MKISKILLCFAIGLLVITIPLMINAAGKGESEGGKAFQQWFPDQNLAKAVADKMNKKLTDRVRRDELSLIKELDCFDLEIQDMSGLEHLKGLEALSINFNPLTQMNLTQCKNLKRLECSGNKLIKLNLNQCKKLEEIICGKNQLTQLDIDQCEELKVLYCHQNKLIKLNLDNCNKLEYLNCNNNELMELDLNSCKKLNHLSCDLNKLTKLDLDGCKELDTLNCSSNELTKLVPNKCNKLTSVGCSDNKMTRLDLSNCEKLHDLDCSSNQLIKVNLHKNADRMGRIDVSRNCIQDFSFIPNKVIDFETGKQNITIDLGKQVCQAGKLTIPVSPNLKDVFGNSHTMKISPDDGGAYDAATNMITWTNLGEEGKVSYSFKGISSANDSDFTISDKEYSDSDDIAVGEDYWKTFASPAEVLDNSLSKCGGKITLYYRK